MTTSFRVGPVRVDRILESEGPFLDIPTLFPQMSADEVERQRPMLERLGALVPDTQLLILAVQSYLLRTPTRTMLIDTCVGNAKSFPRRAAWHQQKSAAYLTALHAAGVSPAEVDVVLCTHLHVDHVGWNTRLVDGRWVPTFPNARYLFGRVEYAHWEAQNRAAQGDDARDRVFEESVLPVVAAGQADFVESDAAIDEYLRLMPTPGHTPGHHAMLLRHSGDEALFTGDVLHSPLQLAHPELSPIFDADQVQAADTRRRVLELMCDRRMLCCTAHFPSPSVFRIERAGRGFTCEPAA